MAHKSLCHAAAVLLCAVIMTYILTSGKKEKWINKCCPFTEYSLTSENVVNPPDQMIRQSAFVRGDRRHMQWRRVPRCHTLPPPPEVISIGLWWHTWQAKAFAAVHPRRAHLSACWLNGPAHSCADKPADRWSCSRGCGATQMISIEDKQAAELKWRGKWKKLAMTDPFVWTVAFTDPPLHRNPPPPTPPSPNLESPKKHRSIDHQKLSGAPH